MEIWLGLLIGILLLQFAVIIGPPYVPTFRRQRHLALDMLDLKPGQKFYDLGCGDGNLLKDAASRGLYAVGYEINPLLAFIAWIRTLRYRAQVKVVVGNFWKVDLSEADGIFVFLASNFMKKLDKLILDQARTKPLKLVSYGFALPGKKPIQKKSALFLYLYH